MIKLEKVNKYFNKNKKNEIHVIDNTSVSFDSTGLVCLLGPSGCGKSTLLSIIAGLEEKTTGNLYIDGEESFGISPKIGYMLQKDSLLEWRSIYKNVIFGLEIRKIKTEENRRYVEQLLKKYHLYEFKDKYPSQLSGGMRQRVALIRTLAIKPKILLLDEAFSAIDYQTRLMVTKDIYKIIKNENVTTLMVTHDISEAISMSDRIIVLTERPATIKSIHNIDFEMENRDPLNVRESPKFSKYFDTIWKELDVNA